MVHRQWVLDTYDNKSIYFFSIKRESDSVSCRYNFSVRILGKGVVNIGSGHLKSTNVLLVEDLKHNILSVKKMYGQGYNVLFDFWKYKIREEELGILVVKSIGIPSNIYILDQEVKNKITANQKSVKDNKEGKGKKIKVQLSALYSRGENPKG